MYACQTLTLYSIGLFSGPFAKRQCEPFKSSGACRSCGNLRCNSPSWDAGEELSFEPDQAQWDIRRELEMAEGRDGFVDGQDGSGEGLMYFD
jgi:hypothetical protein